MYLRYCGIPLVGLTVFPDFVASKFHSLFRYQDTSRAVVRHIADAWKRAGNMHIDIRCFWNNRCSALARCAKK